MCVRCVVQMCKATCEFGFLTLASTRFKRWPRLTSCFPSSPWSWCLVSRQAPSRSQHTAYSEQLKTFKAADSFLAEEGAGHSKDTQRTLKILKSSKLVSAGPRIKWYQVLREACCEVIWILCKFYRFKMFKDYDVQRCSRMFKLIAVLIFVAVLLRLWHCQSLLSSIKERSERCWTGVKCIIIYNMNSLSAGCVCNILQRFSDSSSFHCFHWLRASCQECFEFSTSNFCTSLWFIWFLALVPMTSLSSRTLFATLSRHPELKRAWTILDIWRFI